MPFEFYRDPLPLDGHLSLVLSESVEAQDSGFGVPMYSFEMRPAVTDARMGRIRLRVGWNEDVIKFAGQIGDLVEPSYRGHQYAARVIIGAATARARRGRRKRERSRRSPGASR